MKNKLGFFATVSLLIVIGILIGYGLTYQSDNHSILKAEPSLNTYQPREELDLLSFNEVFISVAEKANPSVVTIFTEKIIKQRSQRSPFFDTDPFRGLFGDDFFDRYFRVPIPEGELRQRGLGSGVIVKENGYVITNNHVVEKADVIKVKLMEDKTYDAELVGTDPGTEIAVLKIKEKNLPVLPFGDSDKLRVGEWVLAIGSPFGEELAHTVTAGIVSAKGRSNRAIADYPDFIQTDAAINPGNSGGALINLRGELVGINTAIVTSGARGFQGVGLAVPVNMAKNVMDQLIAKGKVVRGWLGVYIQDINDDTKKVLDLKDIKGALISQVMEDSPAEKADLRVQDVIKGLDGKVVINTNDLRNRIAAASPGTWVKLNVIRDRKEKDIRVKLGELDVERMVSSVAEKTEETVGIDVSPITPRIASRFRLGPDEEGIVITNVNPSGVGAEAGLKIGDVIKKVNRTNIRSVEDYERAVKNLKKGDSVLMLIKRQEGSFFVSFRIPE